MGRYSEPRSSSINHLSTPGPCSSRPHCISIPTGNRYLKVPTGLDPTGQTTGAATWIWDLTLAASGRFARVYWRGLADTEPADGAPGLPASRDDVGALKIGIRFDLLDNNAIPHHGIAGGMQAWLARPQLGDAFEYGRYWGHLVGAATTGKWTMQLRAQAGGSEGEMPYYRQFLMGGLRDLTGIADGSLRGGAFAMAGAGVLYNLAEVNLPYAAQWYLGAWIDAGNTWEEPAQVRLKDSLVGGAVTLLWETALGPHGDRLRLQLHRPWYIVPAGRDPLCGAIQSLNLLTASTVPNPPRCRPPARPRMRPRR